MMNNFSGFNGAPNLLVSTANQEIIEDGLIYHKFAFINAEECHIRINNSPPILLLAGQGFATDQFDTPVKSFIVVTPNVRFSWVGSFKYAKLYK